MRRQPAPRQSAGDDGDDDHEQRAGHERAQHAEQRLTGGQNIRGAEQEDEEEDEDEADE